MDFLIKNGALRQVKGQFEDLCIVNKKSHKGYKQRYVTTPVYNYLQRLWKEKQKELNKSKEELNSNSNTDKS